MAGNREKIDIIFFYVNRQMSGRLRGIHQKERSGFPAEIRYLPDRLDSTADIRNMTDSDHSGIRPHSPADIVNRDYSVRSGFNYGQLNAIILKRIQWPQKRIVFH